MAAEPVIRVEGLRKNYGDTVAVHNVAFSVGRGEIFGLLGPNGAGKTTTVECLQGLGARDGGHVRVLGLDPATEGNRLRRRIGSQLQSAALPDRLRVGEAVRLFARLHSSAVDAPETLAAWDLERLAHRPFAALSGGERQRLFLALALLGDPEVVFLDELTTGLDPQARRNSWTLVEAVRDRGATVVLVTHLMEEAEALCDRVAIMDRGRVVALDTPRALTAGAGGRIRVSFTLERCDHTFLSRVTGVHEVWRDNGFVTATVDAPAVVDVAAALQERDLRPGDFRTTHPSLEDVFLAMTGRRLND